MEGENDKPSTSPLYYIGHTRATPHPPTIPLLLMACLSFTTLLMDWWEGAEVDLSVTNYSGLNLLSIATSTKLCEILLKRGADVNKPVPIYGNALGAAFW